jgi:hypothetical protein
MRVVEHRTLYENPRFHAAFPSVCMAPKGEAVLLAFRRGRDPRWLLAPGTDPGNLGLSHWDARSHLTTLTLDPRTLAPLGEPRAVPPDPECAEQDASLLVTADGGVLLGSFGWYPVPSSGALVLLPGMATGLEGDARAVTHLTSFVLWGPSVRRSDDGGATFGPHAYLPIAPGSGDRFAERRGANRGALRGAMVERDGEIVLAIYDDLGGIPGARIYVSIDGGRTFAHRADVSDPDRVTGLQEPSLFVTASGAIVMLCRTTGAGDAIVTARSEDGGVTWSPLTRHATRGHPSHALALRSGRVFVAYGYRHAPYGIRAKVVDAELTNLDEAEELIVRDDGAGTDLGYPWSMELPDGRVLVTYYWTTPKDTRVIAGTIVAPA